ncbi:phage tail family protein [Enterococcus faecalis]|nr:phage tail family protein [Enterococcus faecalis]
MAIGKNYPSRAMNINGRFLEDLIPGYQTLDIQGRELFETANEYAQLGIRDGERHIYNRIPPRKLIVKYYLKAEDEASLRDKFNKLNVALFTEKETPIWFNDEPEMLFKGTKSTINDGDTGFYRASGSFTITCGDPYKYTRSDATSVMWGSTEITFQANYLMGNTGSGAVDLPIIIEGGAYWGSSMITFQNRSYLMGDTGQEVKPIEIYPTVEGLKVKPTITIKGTGRGVWIKTRNDTIDIGDFDRSEIVIDTEQFNITKNGKPMIRPMNDFYIYPGDPIYIQAKDSTFNLTIRYPNRFL